VSDANQSPEHPPWLSIWVSPRSTVRQVVRSDPRYGYPVLASIWGASIALSLSSAFYLGEKLPLATILIGALIGGALGLPALYLLAVLYTKMGRVFGGRSSATDMRAALAWSAVPQIPILLVWILRIALFGQSTFTSMGYSNSAQLVPPLIFSLVQLASLPFSIWGIAIWIGAYAEVHQVSTWRGIASLAAGGAFIGAALAAVGVVCLPVSFILYAILRMLILPMQSAG